MGCNSISCMSFHELDMVYPVCNCRPERAPKIFGKTFFLCWRCTGCLVGGILAIYIHSLVALKCLPLFVICCVPAFVDWFLHKIEVWNGNNCIRFITGIILGSSVYFLI